MDRRRLLRLSADNPEIASVKVRVKRSKNGRTVRSASVHRALLYLAAAALSAVVSDWAIEGLASAGAYGQWFVENDHRSIVCPLTGALLLLLCYLASTFFCRMNPIAKNVVASDWLAIVARDIVAKNWSIRSLAKAFVVALVVRYMMETARDVQATGQLASGVDWLGGPLAIALVVHAVFCVAAFFGLIGLMRLLDRTVRGVVALVIAFIETLRPRISTTGHATDRVLDRILYRLSLLARHLGERAPPMFVTARL